MGYHYPACGEALWWHHNDCVPWITVAMPHHLCICAMIVGLFPYRPNLQRDNEQIMSQILKICVAITSKTNYHIRPQFCTCHDSLPVLIWCVLIWWLRSSLKASDFSQYFNLWAHKTFHDDVIEWKHFPRYWPFVRGIHRSPVEFGPYLTYHI